MNSNVQLLLDTLINRDIPPTQLEISAVVKLAYDCGKNDVYISI